MSTAPATLTDKIVALHRAFAEAGLAHAFGGALALAYCTAEPRGTRDIDVNVFIAPDRLPELTATLPLGVEVTSSNEKQLRTDGQTRLWWDDTPVDVFLSNHSFHDQVEANRRFVPFAEVASLPVLACSDLAVFKAFFGRAKDAVDTAAMAAIGAIDLARIERDTATLLDDDTARSEYFRLVRSAMATG